MAREKIGFIGGGNMGAAIMAGLYKNHTLALTELDARKRSALKRKYKCQTLSLEDNFKTFKIMILAVKPQSFDAILSAIYPFVQKDHIIISIAAGITTQYIEKRLPKGTRVIRTMPNLPVQVGYGMTGISAGKFAKKIDLTKAKTIFEAVGEVVIVPERQLDAVTAVSGSGPAYVFYFMESLMKSATQLGLSKDLSAQLVGETLLGSLMLVLEKGECPSDLRKAVTSKGGTTQAALSTLQKKKFEHSIQSALQAAKRRAGELAK